MTMTTTEQNKRAIRRLYEAVLGSSRFEGIGELVADEYEGPHGARGPRAFVITIEELRAAFPDLRYTIEDIVAEGDRVVARWTWSGTHEGNFRAFGATHARVTNKGTVIHRMREGKVAQTWVETDRLGFLEQVGAVPSGLAGGPPAPGVKKRP